MEIIFERQTVLLPPLIQQPPLPKSPKKPPPYSKRKRAYSSQHANDSHRTQTPPINPPTRENNLRDLRPSRGPKGRSVCKPSISNRLLDRRIRHVHRVIDGDIPPPLRNMSVAEVETEADEDGGDEEAGVESCGGDVVVLHPPSSPPALDEIVEDGSNETPAHINVDGCRWDPTCATEHQWGVDIFGDAARPFASQKVGANWEEGTEKPIPLHNAVDLSGAENTFWANGTPDDGSGVEDFSAWAGELIRLVVGTDIRNVAKCPIKHCDLDD